MKVPIVIIMLLISFFFLTCKETKKSPATFSNDTQISIYSGLLTIPKGWRRANDDTLPKVADATARYRFHTTAGKLIYLEYGLSTIGNPAEPNIVSSIFRNGYLRNNADTSGFLFSDNSQVIKMREKGNYWISTDTVSNFKATFFRPKRFGQGYFVMYIDSIEQIAGNIGDLVFYGENLDSLEVSELEKMSRSIIIKKSK